MVMGCHDSPALPLAMLNVMKQSLFLLFPNFWANPVEQSGKDVQLQ